MKIYQKKSLVIGVFWAAMGVWLLALRLLEPEPFFPKQVKGIVLSLLLLSIGIVSVLRAFSQRAAREARLEELDERNQLIALKTNSRSFQLTQGICFCLMLAFFVMGKLSGEELFVSMGIGLGFAYAISLFTELFASFYYEKHN